MAYLCFRERHRNIFGNRLERFVHNRAFGEGYERGGPFEVPEVRRARTRRSEGPELRRSSPTKPSDISGLRELDYFSMEGQFPHIFSKIEVLGSLEFYRKYMAKQRG